LFLPYPPLSDYMQVMEQTSTPKTPVCIAVAPDLLARLDDAAAEMERSRSWAASKAIAEYLARRQEASR
jgi:metal-responsive CopG/Arc/MetJ family transcriptional regulator